MARVIDDSEVSVDPTSHMSGRMTTRIEIVGRVSGRRRWTVEQKLAMLRDAFGSGGCVRTAMEQHEVSSGQLYTWRHQAMSGELTGMAAPVLPPALPGPPLAGPPLPGAMPCFAEVAIAETSAPSCVISEPVQAPPSQIGIELSSGIRLTLDAGFDAEALARVLSVVGR
jgi:transposase